MEEHLIEFVRKHNCLYDKSNPHYKVMPIRDKKFEELSRKLNIPATKLKARWRTLRDTFHKEVKAESFECVSSTKKQWKWMEHLRFLKNVNNANASTPIPARCSSRKKRLDYRLMHAGVDASGDDSNSIEESLKKYDDADTDERTITFPIPECNLKPKLEQMTDESRSEIIVPPAPTAVANDTIRHRDAEANTRSAVQLFFAGLAKQTEDANISAKHFAQLQLKLLQVFNKEVYDV